MAVNGVPSDDWKVNQALGPYAKKPDEDELEAIQRALKKKKAFISRDERVLVLKCLSKKNKRR